MEFFALIGSVVTAKEDATSIFSRETVKPSDGVFKAIIALAVQLEKLFQRLKGNGFSLHPRSSHGFELDVRPRDHAGQAKSADGGAQHIGIHFGIAGCQTVVRAMQSDLANMRTERSSAVMVLAMYVVGDGSAHRNEASSRRDGQEPSLR